jgi:dTDP-4-dehydrorhamnose 3,5-epimerase-like enzyme
MEPHMVEYKMLNFKVHGNHEGSLVALEKGEDFPFEIKRVYWIFDTLPDLDRGFHAHKNMEQIIVAMDGACEFVLDDGKTRESVWLNRPDVGLYIGKNMWREMKNFSYGCKLMVLASEYYDKKLTEEELSQVDERLRQTMLDMKTAHTKYLQSKKKKKA